MISVSTSVTEILTGEVPGVLRALTNSLLIRYWFLFFFQVLIKQTTLHL